MTTKAEKSSVYSRYLKRRSILVLNDEAETRSRLIKDLGQHLGLVEFADCLETADALRQRCYFDLIIADIALSDGSGIEWVQRLRDSGCTTAVIFIAAHSHLHAVIQAMRAGGADFIIKPFQIEQILAAVSRCIERQSSKRDSFMPGRRQVDQFFDAAGMIGKSAVMIHLCNVIQRVAPMPSTILLEGESGTGKELAARSIHALSGRSGIFVPVNCSAISADLLESELFGHVKGAFTGAHQTREGLFRHAHNGTLFLDEISEMPLMMQTRLLRVLEEKSIRAVGSNQEIPVDVRIIAATNQGLEQQVKEGHFRPDLFFRLNVLNLKMPPLRERLEDMKPLIEHFARHLSANLGIPSSTIGDDELALLSSYHWPGNIRELKNVIERSLLLNMSPGACIAGASQASLTPAVVSDHQLQLAEIEKQHILKVLAMEKGNKSAAARLLGVSRKTLERKILIWNTQT